MAIAKNRTSHDSIKQIDIRYHYIRGLIAKKAIQLRYIQTDLNHADVLTKPLPHLKLALHVMGLKAPPLSGSVGPKAMVERGGGQAEGNRPPGEGPTEHSLAWRIGLSFCCCSIAALSSSSISRLKGKSRSDTLQQ